MFLFDYSFTEPCLYSTKYSQHYIFIPKHSSLALPVSCDEYFSAIIQHFNYLK